MSFTYDPSTDIGKIRRDIQDKVESEAQFTDEELQSWLDEYGDRRIAAGLALRSWASSLSREDKLVKTGSWQGDLRNVVEEMLQISDKMLTEAGYVATGTPSFRQANIDWTLEVQRERELNESD